MSIYGAKWKIGGVTTGYVRRIGTSAYEVRFEREFAAIEDVEGIDWNEPRIENLGAEECPLPAGGFAASNPTYDGSKRAYGVVLRLQQTYYGDVRAYEAELENKQTLLDERNATIRTLNGELDAARTDIEQKQRTISGQSETISMQTQQIATLNADLAEADATVMELYEQLDGDTENGGAENE